MSEQPVDGVATGQVPETGNPSVDAVLESMESLDATPVAEHVAVFEAAHERLRRALDAGPEG